MTDSGYPGIAALVLALSAGLHVGCHHQPVPDSFKGKASFQIIEPPVSGSVKGEVAPDTGQPREVIAPAEPFLPLGIPIYPPTALRARDPGALVSVHVSVDKRGNVAEVTPSRFGFTTPGPFMEEYRLAVEAAVKQWKFQPAEIQFIEFIPGKAGELLRKISRREPTGAEFDVAFMFTASGNVMAPPKR